MRIPLSWLREYVDIDLTPEALAAAQADIPVIVGVTMVSAVGIVLGNLLADLVAPCVPVGLAAGRVGNFINGELWGRAADPALPWAARFPPESLAFQSMAARANPARFIAPDHLHTLPIHPVQLYESLGELLLFAFLALWLRPRKRFTGQVMAAWLMLYAILRTVTETFRGDVERGVYVGLGTGQWTSIGIFATGIAIWVVGSRTTRKAVASLPA